MPSPTHTQAFLNKRRLLVFVPVPGVLCLTILFYLGGGGQGLPAAGSPAGPGAGGINRTLPAAGQSALFADKMEAAKALPDSSHRNGLAFTPPITESTTAPPAGPTGLNYAVQPGQVGQKYDPAADPNVVAVQSRMQRLQQQTTAQPTHAAAPAPVASSVNRAAPAPARDERMDASLKELDQLKNQYQQRLTAMNSPAAPTAGAAPVAARTKKTMSVVTQAPRSVVSTLVEHQAAPTASAGNGFHTIGEANAPPELNAVPAVVHDDQVVEQGSTVKMRLLQDVQLEGRLIPRNSFVYGVCNVNGNRLTISTTSVQYQGSLLPITLKAFDLDGGEGLNIPGSASRDALKQGAATGISSADLLTMSPSLGAQAAGIAIQTGKALTGRKIKSVKIHLKANYQLLLKS